MAMNEQKTPWPGFKYQQVPGLANRHIARWLRTQRKTMARLFASRGMYDLVERMQRIRLSRQGMMAKNRMFQEVLDAYARATAPAVPETAHVPQEGALDLHDRAALEGSLRGSGARTADGLGPHDAGSVQPVAREDGSEPVIEE
jgi:hypothetical protein